MSLKTYCKRTLCLLLAILTLLTPALALNSDSYVPGTRVKAMLDEIIEEYPPGSYFYGSFAGGTTCYGFAKMVLYKLFGKEGNSYRYWAYDGSSNVGLYVVDYITDYSAASVKALLSQARPGDLLQFSSPRQHSMIVYEVSENSFTLYDSNWTPYMNDLRTVSYDTFAGRTNSRLTLMRSTNYDEVDKSPAPMLTGATLPSGTLSSGASFSLAGTITSESALTEVRAEVINDATGTVVLAYASYPYTYSYNIRTGGMDSSLRFGSLANGKYLFVITASNSDGYTETLASQSFFVGTSYEYAGSFKDVTSLDWYYDSVSWAVNRGITYGVSETAFAPSEPCTREQIVTFLWRRAGSPSSSAQIPFTDVSSSDYFYTAVRWAYAKGIVAGTSNTTFGTGEYCTRAQAVTMLWRYAGQPGTEGSTNFWDVAADSWYYTAVLWAVANSITNGTGAYTFSPEDACTRAQIVTFLYRYG